MLASSAWPQEPRKPGEVLSKDLVLLAQTVISQAYLLIHTLSYPSISLGAYWKQPAWSHLLISLAPLESGTMKPALDGNIGKASYPTVGQRMGGFQRVGCPLKSDYQAVEISCK